MVNKNSKEEYIYKLLHLALLEIRIETHESKKNIFHIADLFHNIPLQLLQVQKGDKKYSEVLDWLWNRAKEKGCSNWLNSICKKNLNKSIEDINSEI